MEFTEFFRLATGHEPYDYQRRIAEKGFPALIEVPTGTGKTHAVVVTWMYRRFVHPDQEAREQTPRRLVYALPMGVLVEAVTTDIEKLWATLAGAPQDLGLPDTLPIVQLMGGTLSCENVSVWRMAMDSSSIVVGTVDQVVSRQLMRGYGTSRRMYPIDFALITNGAHVVVDEVQLCGQATSTARQVAAFQQRSETVGDDGGPAERTGLTCMSATVDSAYLDTVDNPYDEADIVQLTEGDRRGTLRRRLDATRRVHRMDGPVTEAAVAAAAREHHQPGTLTLVVVNRVDEAVGIWTALAKLLGQSSDAPRHLLVHSRFRGRERAALNERLRTLTSAKGLESMRGTPGHIVVATQAVEAGIDLDAATLITEAASWPSVCQRAGRCNRAGTYGIGEDTTAKLLWFEVDKKHLPYEPADVRASVAALTRLQGQAVTSEELLRHEVERSSDALSILRAPTFEQLFDTSPDLTGGDIDITRYIRSDDDSDVHVAWIESDGISDDPVLVRPALEWRVGVPLTALRRLLKRPDGPAAWVYDVFSERWVRVSASAPVMPQSLVLLDRGAGGYDEVTGFTPGSKARVALIDTDPDACACEREDDLAHDAPSDANADEVGADPATFTQGWQLLESHLRDTAEEADRLCAALDLTAHGFDDDVVRAVIVAAALHDLGKSFPGWQKGLRAIGATSEGTYVVPEPPPGLLAKAPRQQQGRRDGTCASTACINGGPTVDSVAASSMAAGTETTRGRRRLVVSANPVDESGRPLDRTSRHRARELRRRVFRHELVSVLLLRSERGRELLDRLGVSAKRHSLVDYLVGSHHGVLRVTPRDPVSDGRDGSMFLGVVDQEWIPSAELGELAVPGARADLSIFGGGACSWGLASAMLLEEFGPFRLAYLEALVRVSDWRASAAGSAAGDAR